MVLACLNTSVLGSMQVGRNTVNWKAVGAVSLDFALRTCQQRELDSMMCGLKLW